MTAVPRTEPCSLAGPAGRLEAVLDLPGDGGIEGAAIVCHPHPQHGGTMRNKVAHTLARAFARSGLATLRFNFRGTGDSEGRYDGGAGELGDTLAAHEWLRGRYPEGPLWLGGFSFGAAIAIRAALAVEPDGLVTVAPAARRFAAGLDRQPACPWLVIQGDADELVDVDETVDWIDGLEPGPELLILPGAEHFFHGRLNELREAVREFVADAQKKAGANPGSS